MRTTRRGFKTQKEAELALARMKLEIANGTYKKLKPKLTRMFMTYGLNNMKTPLRKVHLQKRLVFSVIISSLL